MERMWHGVSIECQVGDIARQIDVEVVVNAANAELRGGNGVAGTLHRAAGPGMEEECRPLAPIRPGQAVITGGYDLPNRYVIHCLGPVYGVDEPADEVLASCYRNALRLAEQHEIESIAFPAISTGAFGYPMDAAALVTFRVIAVEVSQCRSLRRIRFVLRGHGALEIYEQALSRTLPENGVRNSAAPSAGAFLKEENGQGG